MDKREEENPVSPDLAVALASAQRNLYAYIFSVVPVRQDADDLLQNTNKAILKKSELASQVDHFTSWARQVAYYEILAWRKKKSRDRLLFVNQTILSQPAPPSEPDLQDTKRLEALDICRESLADQEKKLLKLRYDQGHSAKRIAELTDANENSIRQKLFRIRHRLLQCISKRISLQGELG